MTTSVRAPGPIGFYQLDQSCVMCFSAGQIYCPQTEASALKGRYIYLKDHAYDLGLRVAAARAIDRIGRHNKHSTPTLPQQLRNYKMHRIHLINFDVLSINPQLFVVVCPARCCVLLCCTYAVIRVAQIFSPSVTGVLLC